MSRASSSRHKFQSTLLMRGATRAGGHPAACECISIHAPHARSDLQDLWRVLRLHHISIHAPHARSDVTVVVAIGASVISLHAPLARSDFPYHHHTRYSQISIHAPHARSDFVCMPFPYVSKHFNPRSSCEERLLSVTVTP